MSDCSDPIILISSWVNHPETLKAHRDLWIQAFPGETVNYIVYIDAKDYPDESNFNDGTMRDKLLKECMRLAIQYYLVPESLHMDRRPLMPNASLQYQMTASTRDAVVCQMAWRDQVLLNRTVNRIGLIQPDIFPYRKLNWLSLMRGADFYYKPQQRDTLNYAWNGLCFFTMYTWDQALKELVDFQDGFHRSIFTDSGGGLWKLLEVLTDEQKYGWSGQNSLQWSSRDPCPDLPFWIMEHLRLDTRNRVESDMSVSYFSEIQDGRFLHLRAGCNWDGIGKDVHQKRYANFMRVLNEAINDGSVFL
jgi:hypothetical protein